MDKKKLVLASVAGLLTLNFAATSAFAQSSTSNATGTTKKKHHRQMDTTKEAHCCSKMKGSCQSKDGCTGKDHKDKDESKESK